VSTREEEERDREIRRRLNEVVGTEYDAPHLRGFRAWLLARWLKWVLGVLFSVGAMLLSSTRSRAIACRKRCRRAGKSFRYNHSRAR
jgi:hypothetical protein